LKILSAAARWLFAACLPVLLLSAVLAAGANCLRLYTWAAAKYDVGPSLAAAGLPLSDEQLEQVYARLIRYYNSGYEYPLISVEQNGKTVLIFTEEESQHFKDVKGLIRLDYGILLGTGLYALAFAGASLASRRRREFALGVVWGGGLTLGLIALLLVLNTFWGFDQLFVQFHLLFFTNDFWSAPGYMLTLFPEGLFINAAVFGVVAMVLAALLSGGAGFWYLRRHPEEA